MEEEKANNSEELAQKLQLTKPDYMFMTEEELDVMAQYFLEGEDEKSEKLK